MSVLNKKTKGEGGKLVLDIIIGCTETLLQKLEMNASLNRGLHVETTASGKWQLAECEPPTKHTKIHLEFTLSDKNMKNEKCLFV